MVYVFAEYQKVFETPAKRNQEKVIVEKIMNLLNNNKFNNLEELVTRNISYQDFLKNNQMDTVVKHFGNTLNEEDFKQIIERLKQLTTKKQSFDEDGIKKSFIGENEYNSYKGEDKTYFVDNTNNSKSIESQMKDLQNNFSKFQSPDMEKNTENMFKELSDNIKESFNLKYLYEINKDSLDQEESNKLRCAANFQLGETNPIRVDLEKGIIVDSEDNIFKIELENGLYVVHGSNEKENTQEEKSPRQMTLAPVKTNKNTIYSSTS